MHSHVQVGDEILAVNLVDVTHMSLDDVVIIMSIPRRLVLATRHGPHQPVSHSRQTEHKAPPVVVIKRELNEDESDHATSNHVRYYLRLIFTSTPRSNSGKTSLVNWLFRDIGWLYHWRHYKLLSFFFPHTETRDYKLIVSEKIFQNNPPIIRIILYQSPRYLILTI